MCQQCNQPDINVEEEVELFTSRLSGLVDLHASRDKLSQKDQTFADDLYKTYTTSHALSAKQWYWVGVLLSRVEGSKPILGTFTPIHVMFRIANSTGGLKQPKVRLMSDEGTFVQLNFNPDNPGEIKVFRDGWAGHGWRKFAGVIRGDEIIPWSKDRMTDDVVDVIQKLALDPIGTATAMANLLGVCLYCGQRLSDEESKSRGYGRTCAGNWGLPWGKKAA